MLHRRILETSKWDHKLITKWFMDVINQVKVGSFHHKTQYNCPLLGMRKKNASLRHFTDLKALSTTYILWVEGTQWGISLLSLALLRGQRRVASWDIAWTLSFAVTCREAAERSHVTVVQFGEFAVTRTTTWGTFAGWNLEKRSRQIQINVLIITLSFI